jgi:hypothetical protein
LPPGVRREIQASGCTTIRVMNDYRIYVLSLRISLIVLY